MSNISNIKVKAGNVLVVSGSTVELTGSQVKTSGDLVVAGKITANEYSVTFVTSSVILQSGSTQFGDSSGDTHTFTGSVLVDGAVNASSFTGSGAALTNLTASSINNFNADVRGLFSASGSISYNASTGEFSSTADITSVTAGTNLTGGGTSGDVTLSLTSSITSGLNTLTGLTQLSSSQVSGTFSGNGAAITNLTASNVSNFTADVRAQLSGGTGISYNPSTGVIETSGSLTGLTEFEATNVTGSNVLVSGSLTVEGSVTVTERTVTANAVVDELTVADYVIFANASGGALTITLPDPATVDGRELRIKKVDTNTNNAVTLSSSAGNIDGAPTVDIYGAYQSVILVSNGVDNWFIL